MKELVDTLTESKLQLTTEIAALKTRNKNLEIELQKFNSKDGELVIQNESLQRQVSRLSDENEELLSSLDKIEALKSTAFQDLQEKCEKYQSENSAQADKINRIKNRLLEVSRKLTKLKESKVILLETQNEYACSITKWQDEILRASKLLYKHIDSIENDKKILESKVTGSSKIVQDVYRYLPLFVELCNKAIQEADTYKAEIAVLKSNTNVDHEPSEGDQTPESQQKMFALENEIRKLKEEKTKLNEKLVKTSTELENVRKVLPQLADLCDKAAIEVNTYKEEILVLRSSREAPEPLQSVNIREKSLVEDSVVSEREGALRTLEDKIQKLEKDSEEINDFTNKLKTELKETIKEKESLKQQISELVKSNEDQMNSHKKELEILSNNRENTDLVDTLKEKLTFLEEELQKTKFALEENEDLTNKLLQLEKQLEEKNLKLKDFELLRKETDEKDTRISDLLSEMRELNEVLKGRGDVISRQQEKIQEIEQKLQEFEQKIQKLEQKIVDLEKEKEELKKNEEIISTSTISRAEEISRLREVDESLEEKYNKLRILASKLKKKCQEQAEILLKMDVEKAAKNLQALQRENDKLQDEIEELKKKGSSTEETDLKKERESFVLIKKELEKEIDSLKNQLETKSKEFDTQKLELQKLQIAKKQSNVLSLEVEAYEKSLNDVSEKLSEKINSIKELESSIETKDYKIESLKKEIELLEQNLDGEKKHSQELKVQIDSQQQKHRIQEHDKGELQKKYQDLQQESEKLKAEKEELNLALSQTSNENQKLCSALKADKEVLVSQVVTLEETVSDLQRNITTTQRDFEDLKDEFTSYKVKAQSVLRQNQTKESSKERELEEELVDIKAEKERLNVQLKSSLEKLDSSERKISELKTENERVHKRCKELMELIEEVREQNALLLDDNKKQNETYQESLKSHRLQMDTLNLCYKEQIEELERKHKAEIITAKEDMKVASSRVAPFGANSQSTMKSADEQKIDLLLMEREDAEGSESSMPPMLPRRKLSQVQSRSKHDAIPLEELLNSSTEFYDDNFNEEEQDLSVLKLKVIAQDNQMKHLTSLLAETEQDLAKLTQQNALLKDEIRRNERGEEREKHMHNSEYLKNVVVKVSFGIFFEKFKFILIVIFFYSDQNFVQNTILFRPHSGLALNFSQYTILFRPPFSSHHNSFQTTHQFRP